MAELPLEAEETGLDLKEVPPTPELETLEVGDVRQNTDLNEDTSNAAHEGVLDAAVEQVAVLLNDRYLVHPDKPLPGLNSPSARAFAVEDQRDSSIQLYALVSAPDLPVRSSRLTQLINGEIAGLLPIIQWGAIMWPPLGKITVIVIFQQPLGGRLIDRLATRDITINEYEMPKRIIEPLLECIHKLSIINEPHRAIRPENIFFLDEAMEEIVLGPHVISPPGYDQPALLEPIDRCLAQPSGRGLGNASDDIYALGVTALLLILDHNPVASMNDTELLQARLKDGSYSTISGRTRIPMQLVEPLRGMLADDQEVRWDFEELNNWLTGQKINPIKNKTSTKSRSFFKFRNTEHFSPRSLAQHLARHTHEAVKAINSEQFRVWVTRGLDNVKLFDAIKGAQETANHQTDSYQGTDQYLIFRVATLLDPRGPIRYQGLSFMHDGFGPVFATEWIRRGTFKIIGDVIRHDIFTVWFAAQNGLTKEMLETKNVQRKLRSFASIPDPGYGLERALYESNASLSCQSPYVVNDGAHTIEQLLLALDSAANTDNTSTQPVDNHIAAFIAARSSEDMHVHLKALASKKAGTSIVGALSLLATLQWKLHVPPLLGLASWVGGLLGPAINVYHNRDTRKELEREIPRLVRKGSLPELYDLIDDSVKRQKDAAGFAKSRAEWLQAEAEIRDIEQGGGKRAAKAHRSGQYAAAMFSVTISFAVIIVLVLAKMV